MSRRMTESQNQPDDNSGPATQVPSLFLVQPSDGEDSPTDYKEEMDNSQRQSTHSWELDSCSG